jgi:hypothetical protein
MFVTNHVLAGAAIGHRCADRPGTAFVVGLASHLAMDAAPHWGCDVDALDGRKRFLRAARRDGVLGLAVLGVVLFTTGRGRRVGMVAAVAGSVILDLDKPMDHFFGVNPFPRLVQEFHGWVQWESPEWMPIEVATGSLLALADLASIRSDRRRGGGRGHQP